MHIRFILIAAMAGLFALSALASPVETSLRPQLRPGHIKPVDLPVLSTTRQSVIRPMPRPSGLSAGSDQANAGLVQFASANLAFDRWIKGFKPRALSAGIKGKVFDRAFRGVKYNTSVIEKDRTQSEFHSQIWDYLDSAASPVRVENGQKALREHDRTLRRIERKYGVEKEIITAIWGMESTYGVRRGTMPLIESLATLAYDGRRGAFFEKQLIAALQILQNGDVTARNMTGSWAGAMGHTQFIPTSYQAFAVDFRGDGRRDIWSDDPTDALASAAAYFKRSGWTRGQPWGVEVRLPDGFNMAATGRGTKRSPADWAALGVRDMNGRKVANHGAASILIPSGKTGPAFMIFPNFKVITRYNNSESYVIGIGHLSDRLAGGPPIKGQFPPDALGMTIDDRRELQSRLTQAGFDTDGADGVIGSKTRAAISAYQQSAGLTVTGEPSLQLLQRLR